MLILNTKFDEIQFSTFEYKTDTDGHSLGNKFINRKRVSPRHFCALLSPAD